VPAGSRVPYLVLGLVLVVLLGAQTVNRQWSTDYWVHQAAVETFRHDLLDPPEELTKADFPSPSYTPYTFVLAAVARGTGLASITVLQMAAIANLVLFLVGFELFVSALTGRRRVAFWALLATLVCWGFDPWRWSGLLNLNSIGFGLPYPSMFATGLALVVGWALLRYDDSGSVAWLAVVAPGFAAVALTHPFTGVWSLVMLGAVVVHRRLYRRSRVVPLAVAAAVAVGLVLVWPYYSFVGLQNAADSYTQRSLYQRIPLRIVAALPGFYVVVRRFLRDKTDPLALMLIGGLLIYAYGAVIDDTNFGRVLPLILFTAHVGIGILVSDWIERRAQPRVPLVAWLGVSAAIGLVGVLPGLVRTIPRALLPGSLRDRTSLQPITHSFGGLDGALEPGSIVVAETLPLRILAPAYGLGVVAPGRPTPFVDDVRARQTAAFEFLSPDTSDDRRRAIAQQYGVDGVLCASQTCRETFADDDVVAQGPGWTLFRLADG